MQTLDLTISGLKNYHDAQLANDTLRAACDDTAVIDVNWREGAATISTDSMSVRREDLVAALRHVHFDAE